MKLTREKHLDHMVRVVPIIFLGYALQCWIINSMNTPIGGTSLMVLGGLLGAMIGGFIYHDVTSVIVLEETHIRMSFMGLKKSVSYSDITKVINTSPQHNFGTIMIVGSFGHHRFFFVDDADKVMEMIEKKRLPVEMKEAA